MVKNRVSEQLGGIQLNITVKEGLNRQKILEILNSIDLLSQDSNKYVFAELDTAKNAYEKLFVGEPFSSYREAFEEGCNIINILPMLEAIDMSGLNLDSKMNFFIDEEELEKTIYYRALDTFGIAMQKIVAVEECGELIQAISKSIREEKHNIEEEIADVEIMIGQLKEMPDIDPELIKEIKKQKLKRLDEMLLKRRGQRY